MEKSKLAIIALGAMALGGMKSEAADYIQTSRWGILGAGETTTLTHTEPGIVYVPQRINYIDECGNCVRGFQYTPVAAEVITSQSRVSHVDWDKSLIAVPGKLLSCIGDALTPKQRICAPVTQTPYTCAPAIQYRSEPCAPVISRPVVPVEPVPSRRTPESDEPTGPTLAPPLNPIPEPPVEESDKLAYGGWRAAKR